MSNESDLDQLHLAWWAYPGGGKGSCTFDELEEAFKQFLLQVCDSLNFCIRTVLNRAQRRGLQVW